MDGIPVLAESRFSRGRLALDLEIEMLRATVVAARSPKAMLLDFQPARYRQSRKDRCRLMALEEGTGTEWLSRRLDQRLAVPEPPDEEEASHRKESNNAEESGDPTLRAGSQSATPSVHT